MKTIILTILLAFTTFAQSPFLYLMGDDGYSIQNFEVQRYADALTTPLSDAQLKRIDILVSLIKDSLAIDSLPQRFDDLLLLANETSEAALKNLIKRMHDATQSATPTTFTQWQGFIGDGSTSYLNTNYNPKTQGSTYTLNSASFGFYFSDVPINESIGSNIGTEGTMVTINATGGEAYGYLNCGAYGWTTVAPIEAGLWVNNRTASNALGLIINGNVIVSRTTAATAIVNGNIILCGYRQDNTYKSSTTTQSAAFLGSGFTTAELRKITNCINWYMDDLPQ